MRTKITASHTNLLISLGFVLVIVLLLAIAGVGLNHMRQIKNQLDDIVLVHNKKTKLIAKMRHSNRERIISLQRMVILDDPFEIDDQALLNMSLANQFIQARRELEALTKADDEHLLLNELRRQTMTAAPLNDRVRDLIWDDENKALAEQLMVDAVIPAQNEIFGVFNNLGTYYERANETAVAVATAQYKNAFRNTIALLLVEVMLSILIAWFVISRSSRAERELTRHRDHLEQLVTERTQKLQQEINERKQAQQQLSFQASHDELTGLINRRELERRLSAAVAEAAQDGVEHSLCFLDLDQFKIVNDTCGHMAGDQLLQQLVSHLRPHIRTSDTFARLGGDEFGILLRNCSLEIARTIADKIRLAVEEFRFFWGEQVFSIGVSIGVVKIDRRTADRAVVMSNADAACYMAKEQGRNRVNVHDADDVEIEQRRGEMQWTSRLQQALDHDFFELYYQPIVNIQDPNDTSLHLEILLRLRDADDGVVPPGAFLPAAERYGMLASIDRWVVANVVRWLGEHHALMPRGRVAINIAGETLSDRNFLGYVQDALAAHRVPANCIVFEITESSAIKNLQHANQFIQTLKADGCLFSLDDFGSGLSSFAYLKNLPVDYLKIDGSFVRDILNDPVDEAMVSAISQVAHSLKKRTIGEFVENDLIRKRLQKLGINYAQGYGIARPEPLRKLNLPALNQPHRAIAG